LTAILQSPDQQRRMAEQNFSAAIQMTLPSVVRNYLRWFELNRRKKAVGSLPLFQSDRSLWQRFGLPRLGAFSPGLTLRSELAAESEQAASAPRTIELSNGGWQRSETGD